MQNYFVLCQVDIKCCQNHGFYLWRVNVFCLFTVICILFLFIFSWFQILYLLFENCCAPSFSIENTNFLLLSLLYYQLTPAGKNIESGVYIFIFSLIKHWQLPKHTSEFCIYLQTIQINDELPVIPSLSGTTFRNYFEILLIIILDTKICVCVCVYYVEMKYSTKFLNKYNYLEFLN